ncbi:MotA/TolQ/ExbB proton channel family protein [Methylobacter marinus]|jgi:biopolymer transport protein ExbB|uniref:MotA/TolQ/ExbB proton channel family protein n=1 Tax=Methylobacter marinus TaxID=34058 RepID=UPI000375A4EF|nr:MotA/TolQ/ExbB proton channel family protein [Methylobacter marinus]
MTALLTLLDAIQDFLNAGGPVLRVILLTSIALWTLVAEWFLFFNLTYPQRKADWVAQWERRRDKASRPALGIRECLISEARINMTRTLPIIKMLISLCPLLGLLGTVTGMIQVFDVMAVTGTSNTKAMASGVSHATIPTMAGMVIAIAGLYFNKLIEARVSRETHHLTDLLTYH